MSRIASFVAGLVLIWLAAGSPLGHLDGGSLTAHMAQHLLLMTFAPPLIWLGAPATWHVASMGGRLLIPWIAATATLVVWHVPAAFRLGMHSHMWHAIEQISFLAAGLFFWLPVMRPWMNDGGASSWSIVLYLFLATLPCDILSAFLVFSDRVAYSVYLSPSRSTASVLSDQQFAGALMWTCVTLVYFVAGAAVSTRLLTPARKTAERCARLEVAGRW